MPKIERLSGREILDSRGRPTVRATCLLEGGICAAASVPSGASTGTAEAFELRDGDPRRYQGLGCRRAAANIDGAIHDSLAGRVFTEQFELDRAMIALDGTRTKSRIGANAVLAVSIAFARACAAYRGVPLYQHFADMLGSPVTTLPRLTINLLSGGKHAGNQVSIQDVLIIPISPQTIGEVLVSAFDIYQSAAELVLQKYGMRLLTADEGGLGPPCKSAELMLDLAVEAIERAGYAPGRDVFLGVDVAATHFYQDRRYRLDSELLDSPAMIRRIAKWIDQYPILSVEDGLAEDDWENWPRLREMIAGRALTLGDDLLCTSPDRIRRAVEVNACDALLLKVNQIGTLTEALEAYRQARAAGWSVTLSVRSGETEDNWAADLAIGWHADQFKNGSIRHSERLAKYNRLLEIEETTKLTLTGWPGRA
ncbi:MAG: enolase [Alloacidobacterium sp.]|jgi:enolase